MFVVVDTQTRCIVRHPRTQKDVYVTHAAAQAAVTRISKMGKNLGKLEVMDKTTYLAQVPQIQVTNLMTGKQVQIAADTPWCCRPDSESYWSA